MDVVQTLAELGIMPSSMIDISDGLASEIHHLGMHSGCGFDVYDEKLPIDPQAVTQALNFDLNPSVVALNGGEDYELLFTVARGITTKIKATPILPLSGMPPQTREHTGSLANPVRALTSRRRAGSTLKADISPEPYINPSRIKGFSRNFAACTVRTLVEN